MFNLALKFYNEYALQIDQKIPSCLLIHEKARLRK